MLDEQRRIISEARAVNPAAVVAAAARQRRPFLGLMIIAADHAPRSVIAAGQRPMAMANRADLLGRILLALRHPCNLLYPPDDDVAAAVDIAVSLL